MNERSKDRVIGYIDGFNLYYGLKDRGWKQFYWLDPAALVHQLVRGGRSVVGAKYFTARVRDNTGRRERQGAFLDAVRITSDAEVIQGKYYRKMRQCRRCNHAWTSYEEKMTDSAIAAHLVADAFLDAFDTALLVGGDTDIVPAIKMVRRHFPEKRIEAWFPPRRKNQEVADTCHDSGSINGAHLGRALMPSPIDGPSGVSIECPIEWLRAQD